MESYYVYCVVFLTVCGYSSADRLPFERPCHDLSPECIKNTLQSAIPLFADGSPELGLEPLDPYIVDQLNLKLPGIKIQFSEGHATGLRTCIVDFARIVEGTLEMQTHCNLTFSGKYRSTGKLLIFPVNGNGDSLIECENLRLLGILKLGSKVKDGQKYLEIKSYDVRHAYDGKVSYRMTNLFGDNIELSKALLNFMNTNWLMIAKEFGQPLVEFGVTSVMKNVRRFLEVVPLDELTII